MVKTMGKADVESKRDKSEKQEAKSQAAARPAKSTAKAAKKGAMPLEVKLCWITLGAAGLLASAFLLDLIIGFPFGKASVALDILVLIATSILGYLAWDTLRELQ